MKLLTKITLGAFALPAMQVVAQTTKPNIILIMTDQQSYAISAHADMYGGSYFSTPNIDRLAKEGLSFTRTFVLILYPSPHVLLFSPECSADNMVFVRISVRRPTKPKSVRCLLKMEWEQYSIVADMKPITVEKYICLSPPKRASLNLLLRQGMVLKLTLPIISEERLVDDSRQIS